MDDADLKSLSVDQVGLSPDYNKTITSYKLVVASNVENLKISAITSDNGASFSIKSCSCFKYSSSDAFDPKYFTQNNLLLGKP